MGCGSSSTYESAPREDDVLSGSSSSSGGSSEEAFNLQRQLAELGVVSEERNVDVLRDIARLVQGDSKGQEIKLIPIASVVLAKWLDKARARVGCSQQSCECLNTKPSVPAAPTEIPPIFTQTLPANVSPQNTPRVRQKVPLRGIQTRHPQIVRVNAVDQRPTFVDELMNTRQREMAGQGIRLGLARHMPHNAQARTAPVVNQGDSVATPAFGVATPGFGAGQPDRKFSGSQARLTERLPDVCDSPIGELIAAGRLARDEPLTDSVEANEVLHCVIFNDALPVDEDPSTSPVENPSTRTETFTVNGRTFRAGEIVKYWSSSKHQWLDGRVCRVATDGRRLVIDKQLIGCMAKVEPFELIQSDEIKENHPLAAFEALEASF